MSTELTQLSGAAREGRSAPLTARGRGPAGDKLHVVIHSMGMPFGPRTVYEASLGGSETAAYYLAHGLAQRGHRVSVWTTREAPQEEVGGVMYVWAGRATEAAPLGEQFEFYARTTPHDVLIIQRHPLAFHKRFAAKVCIWQLHDLALKRSQPAALSGMWQVSAVTGVSDWHVEQIKAVWGFDDRVLHTVPNGADPRLYTTAFEPPFIKSTSSAEGGRHENGIHLPAGQYILLYQSRPERGFEHLVRPGGIMDRVRHLPVHLIACAYDNVVPQMRAFYDQLARAAAALPNVTLVGALTKLQLAELQRKADLLIYPTEFGEASCITAMEAMHAALPLLTSAVGALPETCAGSGSVLLPLKGDKADEDAFVAWLEAHLADTKVYPLRLQQLREAQKAAAAEKTWDRAVERLEALALRCLNEASDRKRAGAVLRTAIERSDIAFARWYREHFPAAIDADAIAQAAAGELDRLYAFTGSSEQYAAHYAQHQGVYYDDHEDLVIGEDVTRTTRFRGVQQYLMQHCHETENLAPAVLDYGCAHGHYLMPLAKELPAGEFHGIDISARAIAAAQKWIERDRLKNVRVQVGGEETLASIDKRFDVILAGEVLEHVLEPWRLLKAMAAVLKSGGCIIATTPFGRWEHSGTEAFRAAREHLHHFDREDIEEICAGHALDIVCAPASHDRSGEALGSWVWRVRPLALGAEFFRPNYERKLKTYAPRETVSACLIVKDGEKTLRKCVESFVDWVDEVRIFIDPKTRDRTGVVAQQLAADFPNRAFTVVQAQCSALVDGFDAARNESIEAAAGDWILWCDADEEMHHAPLLHKLVRPSMHDGYGCAQVHYAIDPPSVLTTDYPCRLFRNHRSIRFYGLVHEHPEVKMGEAVPTSVVRPELSFLHCGYVDEETRRRRYQRNLPLLKRDLKTYPDRKLNKFLWLRDLAQGMLFEQEQMGGAVTAEHLVLAREGIKLFESMITDSPPRLLSDAMPYYSHCVATVGEGFDSKIEIAVDSPIAPGLAVKTAIIGRFHSREFYKRVVAHFLEESTKTYEDKYL